MVTGAIEQNLLGSLLGRKKSAEEECADHGQTGDGPAAEGESRAASAGRFPGQAAARRASSKSRSRASKIHACRTASKSSSCRSPAWRLSAELGLLTGAWTESKPGTASLAGQMLTKGTAKHTEKELAEELETYAINLGGNASPIRGRRCRRLLARAPAASHAPHGRGRAHADIPGRRVGETPQAGLTSLAISDKEPATIAEREMRKATIRPSSLRSHRRPAMRPMSKR